MRMCQLSTLCDIHIGKTPSRNVALYWGKGYKWVSISDMKEKVITSTKEEITKEALIATKCQMVPKGTLLMSFKLTIGKLAFAGENLYTNEAIAALQIKDPTIVNSDYLYFVLSQTRFNGGNQAVMGMTLNSKSLATIQIPLPELDEQIRIADVLSRAERLLAMRKESIKILDDLVQSTFLEMFGDPVKNEKKWPTEQMSDVVLDIISGTSYGGKEKKTLANDELGVLKISAVTQGVFNPEEIKAVKKDEITKKIITVRKGMLLFSRANTKELVAACCLVDADYPKLFLPDKLWSVIVDDRKVNSMFLCHVLKNKSFRDILRNKASGGHESMLNISMQKFYQQEVIAPPLKLQKEFAKIVLQNEITHGYYKEYLDKLESLNYSIIQQVFRKH